MCEQQQNSSRTAEHNTQGCFGVPLCVSAAPGAPSCKITHAVASDSTANHTYSKFSSDLANKCQRP